MHYCRSLSQEKTSRKTERVLAESQLRFVEFNGIKKKIVSESASQSYRLGLYRSWDNCVKVFYGMLGLSRWQHKKTVLPIVHTSGTVLSPESHILRRYHRPVRWWLTLPWGTVIIIFTLRWVERGGHEKSLTTLQRCGAGTNCYCSSSGSDFQKFPLRLRLELCGYHLFPQLWNEKVDFSWLFWKNIDLIHFFDPSIWIMIKYTT
jgi:hypothetical protein